MILGRHCQKIMLRNYKTLYRKKATRKVCSAHMISINTALLPGHTKQKENKETTCIQMILTIDVLPRNSQDDKILPEHVKKINPKYPFIYEIQIKLSREPNRPQYPI